MIHFPLSTFACLKMRPSQILGLRKLSVYFVTLLVAAKASTRQASGSDHFVAFSCGPRGLIHHTNETNGLKPEVSIICPKMPVWMDTRTDITCEVISNTYANITWFHSGQPISDRKKHKSYVKADRKTCNQTLKIKRAGTSDSGNYTCLVVNSVGEVKKTCSLEVKADERKQVHIEYLKIAGHRKKAFLQGSVNLTCSMFNVEGPVWLKSGRKIISNRHVWKSKATFGGRRIKSYLEINNVTKDDEGLYTCLGRSRGVSINKTLYLQTETCPHGYYCPYNGNIAIPCPPRAHTNNGSTAPTEDDTCFPSLDEEPSIASVVNKAGLSTFDPKHISLLMYALLVSYSV